jgi:hypothetical protein
LAQGYVRPDGAALSELGDLLQHVGEELAAWRRRSLKAEAELAEARSKGGVLAGPELIQARKRAIDLMWKTRCSSGSPLLGPAAAARYPPGVSRE